MPPTELNLKMSKVNNPLLLWSSDDFVRTYTDFRCLSAKAEAKEQKVSTPETLFVFEDMLVVMCQGMGHDSTKIRRGDLLAFFITNVDELDPAIGSPWHYGQKPWGSGEPG